ncbi:MAG: DUF1624 domain-containing protein [Bdellovibrio sp.]|nr:MAG: DUF1624 domain-containing protein [Bdellovibrio sp.]
MSKSKPPVRAQLPYLIRGVAVILMIFYHFLFDVENFISPLRVPWLWIWGPEVIAGMFLLAAGLSSAFIYQYKPQKAFSINFKRFIRLIGIGLILLLITLLFTNNYIIVFGILTCIGFSILLGHFLLPVPPHLQLTLALLIIIGGNLWDKMGYYNQLAYFLQGLMKRSMLDFFPMIPWVGYLLLGQYLGLTKKAFFEKEWPHNKVTLSLAFLGKHSLLIYLIHQPIIFLLLFLFGFLPFKNPF